MALTGTKEYRNYIGGEWVEAAGGETFETKNPATGETLGIFPLSTTEDMDRAVAAAKDAYEHWRLVPAPKRAELLFRVAQMFVERKDDLTREMVQEMGKVQPEAAGDVQEAIDMTYYMAGEGRRLFGQTTPVRASGQVHDVDAEPGRSRRRDHALELPDRHPELEDHAGARLRQHGRAEAGRGHASPGRAFRRDLRGVRAPSRRTQHRPRSGGGRRRPPRPPSGRAAHLVHGLARSRNRGDEAGGAASEARPPRARRQERDHRHGRRGHRSLGERNRLVGLRHVGSALHRGEPRDRERAGLRRASDEARLGG